MTRPTVLALEGVRVSYAWGSHELIPALRGEPPAAEPEAETWFGAHEANPSTVLLDGRPVPLRADLGLALPTFLVKLLAAGRPLSLQVHPDRAMARAGFAAEEAAGVPRDAPSRRYRDPSDKPEMLRALTRMHVLCGLRSAVASRRLVAALVPEGLDDIISLLAQGDVALRPAVEAILRAPQDVTRSRLAAVADGLASFTARPAADVPPGEASDPELPLVAGIVADLLRRHPRDAGVLLALLLRAIVLEPGQAVHVGPGVLHAYLSGLGVEVMAASDNVLRGGLTEKHVDVEEFLRVLDARVGDDPRVGALAGPAPRDWRRLLAPTSAFLVDEADLDGTLRLERSGTGPSIVLCARGDVIVRAADGSAVRLRPGDAAYVATGTMPVQIAGVGLVFHARAGSDI